MYRREITPKKSRKGLLIVPLVLAAAYSATLFFWPLPATAGTVTTPVDLAPAAAVLDWPAYGQSAFATDSSNVLDTSGTQQSFPMASITKVVTALVVLEAKPLTSPTGENITFTSVDESIYNDYLSRDGSVAPVASGMALTQYEVMQAMLLPSANNYADSYAVWGYGSMPAYLSAANTYLQKHNLLDTAVADASGFSPDSKSSARDLARLGQLALAHTALAEITQQETADIPGIGTLTNTNRLLGVDGVIGMKTGTTDEAGACLLYAAQFLVGSQTVTVVGATLGAPNHITLARDVRALLATIKTGFAERTVLSAGQTLGDYQTLWDSKTPAVAAEDVTAITWSDQSPTVAITLDSANPASTDEPVGEARVTSLGIEQTIDVTLSEPLAEPSLLWRLTHPLTLLRS